MVQPPRAAPPLHFQSLQLYGGRHVGPQTSYRSGGLTLALFPNGFWSLFSTDDPRVVDGLGSEGSAGGNEKSSPFGRSGVRSQPDGLTFEREL